MELTILLLASFVVFTVSSPIPSKQYRSDYEYNQHTDAFYKLHARKPRGMSAARKCIEEGAEKLTTLASDAEVAQVQAMVRKYLRLNLVWDNLSVLPGDWHAQLGSGAFVCKVAAKNAPHNKDCGVYSNDYESKISTTGSCYRVYTVEATWDEAHASCQAEGAHLVILDNAKELEVLYNMLKDKPHDSETQYYAGVRADTTTPQLFKTVLNHTLEEVGYGPWEEEEPNNWHNSGENCVVLDTRRNGKYNDVACYERMPFVCESYPEVFEAPVTPANVFTVSSPIPSKQYRSDYEYNQHTDAFYKLHARKPRGMSAARKCIEEGAEKLTTLASDAEVAQVQAMVRKYLRLNLVWDNLSVLPGDWHAQLGSGAFVCKVAAKNAPHNKDCGVYSNDYESKISTTGSCYRVYTVEATWDEAHASCQAEGAHLVILDNAKELEVLYNMLKDKPHDSETQYYAGVRADTTTPQLFKTVLNHTLEEVGYGPWEEEEPNNWHNSGENCVVLDTRRNGKYNDVACYERMPFVCESYPEVFEAPVTPANVFTVSSPIPSKQYRSDYEYNQHTDAFYKLHARKPRGMSAARKCIEEGAEKLTTLASDAEVAQVQAMVRKYLRLNLVWDNLSVLPGDWHAQLGSGAFVCKVAAKNAPHNKDCGVYSNDYESKISTTGSCYRVYTVEATWDEAHASCQAEGAHLVILDNAKELEVLYNMLKDKPHDSETQYYAGVRADTTTPQLFKTVLNHTLEEVGYGPWEEEEPNNWHNSGENCVVLDTRRNGKYNDVACYERMPFVCESYPEVFEAPVTPANVFTVSSPIPSKQYRSDYEYNQHTDAFYKLHARKPRGMSAARKCIEEGAEKLTTLASDADVAQVQAMVRKYLRLNWMWDNLSVLPGDWHASLGSGAFVCKVAAKNAPHNKDCGVYSNDYESKISTTGSCYRVYTIETTWDEAHASCQAEGAHLVILDNAEELEVLYNMLKDKPHDSETQYYAGVRADAATPQLFKTVLNHTLEEVGYGPWEEEEPNNWHNSGENCVVLDTRRNGKYNDVACYERMPFVCESYPEVFEAPVTPANVVDANAVSSAIPSKQYRPGYEYNKNTDAFYKLHIKGENKVEASDTCRGEGAELAKVTSDEDLKQIHGMMKKLSNLEDYVMVASDDDQCNVINRRGKIERTSSDQVLPFVCKVAAKDAPYNKACGVYSNDYESKISTTGSCYRVSTVDATWNEAYANCQAEGAHLVILDNAKELELLYNMLQDKPHDSETQYFAGVRADTTTEPRVFKTVLNQTLEEVGYGPWEEEEPNDWHGGENCVVLDTRRHGKYNDVWCHVRMPYVCESSGVPSETVASPSSTPSTVSNPVSSPVRPKQYRSDYEYNKNTDAFYKLHSESASKYTASRKCIEEGAELAKITSDEDLKQIHAMMKKLSDLEDFVMVASDENSDNDSQNGYQSNVVNRKGKVETTGGYQDLPFVCKVAAKAAPYNEECSVYSNDYVSRVSSTGSCYRISTNTATWNEAYANCQVEGAHLVILSNAEELKVLYDMLDDKLHDSETQYFAGVRADTTTEPRVFKTVLNETLEQVGYGPWEEEEPNDWHGGENCVVLDTRRHGKYNDVWCHVRMPYVCESNVKAPLEIRIPPSKPSSDAVEVSDPVPSPGPSKQYLPGYEYNEKTDAFYKLHPVGARKMDASEKCIAEGAELVDIVSEEDSKQVLALMKKLSYLEDYVMVKSNANSVYGSRNYNECNVMNRKGKIETTSAYQELPFVCKVAAANVPYDSECDVFSNDYESRISTTGSCYRVSTVDATWNEAYANCQAEGAHLVILSSANELEVLYNMLQDKPHNSETQYFTGVRADTTIEPRVFKTVLNQTLEEVGYGPWEEEEPNDWHGGENCVVLDTRRHGKYNDVWCHVRMPYVCERSGAPGRAISEVSVPVSSLPPSKQYRPDYEYNKKTDAFYKLHTDGLSKRRASKKCIEEGAELAKITSEEDLKQIRTMMKRIPKLEESVMVASEVYMAYGSRNDFECNVVKSEGEIMTANPYAYRPFVCKVTARNAPINKECRVFSNDYESRISSTGSCYRVSTVDATWDEANAICQAEGAHLVILNDADELEVLVNMLKDKPHDSETQYYAGVRAVTFTEPRLFKTVLNQTLEEVGYGPWDESEPNNWNNDDENCVALDTRRHGKYNDVPCYERKPYVCERSRVQVEIQSSSSTNIEIPTPPSTYHDVNEECGVSSNDYESRISTTGSCYRVSTVDATWDEANAICQAEGAHLVILSSAKELDMLVTMLQAKPHHSETQYSAGVRAVTSTEPRVFKTVLNQTLEEVGYGPWEEGEPNDFEQDGEYCVVMDTRRNGKYNDVPCDDRRPYVCEKTIRLEIQSPPSTNIEIPSSPSTYHDVNEECGVSSNDYESRISTTGSCYRVSTVDATWDEANAICQSEGAHLVILSSVEELDMLVTMLQAKPHHSETQYSAGVRAVTSTEPRVFRTVLNQSLEEVGYGPWEEGEPNNFEQDGEYCVVMDTRRNGKYNDVPCDDRRPYVCEKSGIQRKPDPSPKAPKSTLQTGLAYGADIFFSVYSFFIPNLDTDTFSELNKY